MNKVLNAAERDALLAPLLAEGWSTVEGRDAIEKHFTFKNFAAAFGWMSSAAIWSEKYNHHPEWSNVYNKVHVVLTTHSVDGLSAFDIKLAHKLESL